MTGRIIVKHPDFVVFFLAGVLWVVNPLSGKPIISFSKSGFPDNRERYDNCLWIDQSPYAKIEREQAYKSRKHTIGLNINKIGVEL